MKNLDNTPDTPEDDQINWARVQRWVQTGILFLMGLYFIDLALPGGNLSFYINVSDFAWLTWLGAALLILMALINALELLSEAGDSNLREEDALEGHFAMPGNAASWVFLGILAAPLMLGLGVPAQPLGAGAIGGEVTSDVRSVGFNEKNVTVTQDAEDRNLLDWIRVFARSTDLAEFEGQEVTDLMGFVHRDARFEGTDRFMLVRFTLSCCVADARPIGLIIETPEALNFPVDTWLEVSGPIVIQEVDGIETPVIQPESITEIDQPEHPYLYF
ncbi:MAG: TIGR03943 family putative permease subunit [Anaerolineales bacterium]